MSLVTVPAVHAVGGPIVAEVLLGLLSAEGGSWLAVDLGWHPAPPRSGAPFTLVFAAPERAGHSSAGRR